MLTAAELGRIVGMAYELGASDAKANMPRAYSEQEVERAAYDAAYDIFKSYSEPNSMTPPETMLMQVRDIVLRAASRGWVDAETSGVRSAIRQDGTYDNSDLDLNAVAFNKYLVREYNAAFDLQKSTATTSKYLLWGGIAAGALALLGVGYLASRPSRNPARGGGRKLLGSGKPPRKFQIGDIVEVNGDPPFQGRVDYIFDYDQELGDYRYKLRLEHDIRQTYNEKSLRLIRKASRNPASGFTVKLDNMSSSDEDPQVTASVSGNGAAKWAKDDQTIDGTIWESRGDPDFAYAVLSDDPGLVGRLEAEGYELDLAEYFPPDEHEEAEEEEEEEEQENPARGSSTRDYDETTSIIEGMVTDAKFSSHVPQGMWGEVKQVLTALVGNGMDGVAEKFAAGMRKGNLNEVFVDDRVIAGMKKVSSGYEHNVTSAKFVKAFRSLRAAVR